MLLKYNYLIFFKENDLCQGANWLTLFQLFFISLKSVFPCSSSLKSALFQLFTLFERALKWFELIGLFPIKIYWKTTLSQKPLQVPPLKSVMPHCIQAPVTSVNKGDTGSV